MQIDFSTVTPSGVSVISATLRAPRWFVPAGFRPSAVRIGSVAASRKSVTLEIPILAIMAVLEQ